MYLLFDDVAEIVEDCEPPIQTPHSTFPRPSVIRLIRYVNVPRKKTIPLTTRAVLARDRYTCAYCGDRADTMDHVIPRSRPDGPHTWLNVVAACKACNNKKDNRTPEEMGWELRIQPTVPGGPSARVLAHIADPSWLKYLGIRT